MYHILPLKFDDEISGISNPHLNQFAHQVWQEVVSQGYSEHRGDDKTMRTVFGQIQFHLEQQLLESIDIISFGEAIWIFHTPDIPTPLVTKGGITGNLIANDILSDKDKTRMNTALERTKIIQNYLAKGGIIIVAHQEKSMRTPEQKALFLALKNQYPKQVIDFMLMQQYPSTHIGATYLMKLPSEEIVEITNQGVQINVSENATWGVWLQERHYPNMRVNQHLQDNINFLIANGLQDVLEHHAHQQGIAPEKYLMLLKRYMKGSDALQITPNKK